MTRFSVCIPNFNYEAYLGETLDSVLDQTLRDLEVVVSDNASTDGSVALTAFIPNDRAFQVLAKDLTGRWYWSESRVFSELAGAVGIDAIEQVLLYHVVPGATITKRDAVRANGATLTTAQGDTFTVRVYNRWVPVVELRDQDRDDVNPFLNSRALDINKGNKQIAHGIVFVLRPFDL